MYANVTCQLNALARSRLVTSAHSSQLMFAIPDLLVQSYLLCNFVTKNNNIWTMYKLRLAFLLVTLVGHSNNTLFITDIEMIM